MRRQTFAAIFAAALYCFFVGPTFAADQSTIVIYGATGKLGGKIATEALNRGHKVIGVSRDPSTLNGAHANLSAVAGDVTNVNSMLEIIVGADVVVIAVAGIGADNTPKNSIVNQAALTFIQAARGLGASAPRVIQIGGGTTLRRNGVLGLESANLEEGSSLHGRMWGHWVALQNYRATTDIRWTVLTPPPSALIPGERTGVYRLGTDELLLTEDGAVAPLSEEDLAAVVIDEVENARSIGQRITAAY